jgi:adenosylmethionine-8-amino-7-oxononanoate aminotransferase
LRWRRLFAREGDRVAAVVVEPLLQGAAGMRTYPPAYLRRLRELATAHGTFLIADEVLTGFGRTGTRFACVQAGVTPDLLCCSKALTGGTLPLAATLATEAIYGAFLSRDPGDAFLHGHSYTGNPIACAAALAALSLLDDAALARARAIGDRLGRGLAPLVGRPGVLDVRGIGLVRAVELGDPEGRGYLAETATHGGRGLGTACLRPLGPALYALPRSASRTPRWTRSRRRCGPPWSRCCRGRGAGLHSCSATTVAQLLPALTRRSKRLATVVAGTD